MNIIEELEEYIERERDLAETMKKQYQTNSIYDADMEGLVSHSNVKIATLEQIQRKISRLKSLTLGE